MRSAGILGLGKYLPTKVITNQDIVNMGVDTSNEWIVERTGIKERRITSEDQATSDIAYEAAKKAILDSGVSKDEIDLILVATSTPDHPLFPSTACLLQKRLGLRDIGAFDLAAACSGFNYALTTATQYVQTGQARNVLVVAADCLSKYVDWTDRSICILFGDGAAAAVVGEVESGFGVIHSSLHSDGGESGILKVENGGSRHRFKSDSIALQSQFIEMNGRAVFKVAVNRIVPSLMTALDEAKLSISDLDFFVPHQANKRIIEYAADKLHMSENQVAINIEKYGNTSAASIPIALTELKEKDRLKEGDIIATIGFGAGFTWGVNLIRWGGF